MPVDNADKPRRKVMKPIVEKRRRTRINASLLALKTLLTDVIKEKDINPDKMEKAEVLELAVNHLKGKRVTGDEEEEDSKGFMVGYNACAEEVRRYVSASSLEKPSCRSIQQHLKSLNPKACSPKQPIKSAQTGSEAAQKREATEVCMAVDDNNNATTSKDCSQSASESVQSNSVVSPPVVIVDLPEWANFNSVVMGTADAMFVLPVRFLASSGASQNNVKSQPVVFQQTPSFNHWNVTKPPANRTCSDETLTSNVSWERLKCENTHDRASAVHDYIQDDRNRTECFHFKSEHGNPSPPQGCQGEIIQPETEPCTHSQPLNVMRNDLGLVNLVPVTSLPFGAMHHCTDEIFSLMTVPNEKYTGEKQTFADRIKSEMNMSSALDTSTYKKNVCSSGNGDRNNPWRPW